jgi:1-deoxy-D-xylulose-5-phosphate synthase
MLERINLPSDLKNLKIKELNVLAEEIREQILYAVNKNGGHLASNLGTVELILALHYVFDTPKDKLVFDVGHQCYAHKIITGRRENLGSLRMTGGLSGFLSPSESEYDTITAGHSSTSLSQALGICRARDLKGENFNVIAVIGDGALGSGMAFEALNDIGSSKTRLIIVLNDNEMSIEKNVGAISKHLSRLRLNKRYLTLKKGFRKFIFSVPLIGKPLRKMIDAVKHMLVKVFVSRSVFDCFGISYAGTYDGNDVGQLIKAFKNAALFDKPVLIHVYTKKGKGYAPAEENPEKYHSVRKGFAAGKTEFSHKMGEILSCLAEKDKRIIAVTAAMKDGTGLNGFSAKFPQRFFDVGICEAHAVTMCAGLASKGFKPYFCVYSTFLQRAFDQISNDICIPKLPVTLVIDKAGLIGSDGETHHGIIDVSYLCSLPNMTVYCPKDLTDLENIMEFSLNFGSPLSVRLENEYFGEFDYHGDITNGKWEILSPLNDVNIIAYGGRMLHTAFAAKKILENKGINIGIINAAFLKPFDKQMLSSLQGTAFVLEESLPAGGLYSITASYICQNNLKLKAYSISLPDKYITHGDITDLLKSVDMSPEDVAKRIYKAVKN